MMLQKYDIRFVRKMQMYFYNMGERIISKSNVCR